MGMINLLSDTVTTPTPEMRSAMMTADVGDDVFNADPTVIKLQKKAAEMLNKEAAIFVPSGTMGNEIALKVHIQPGDAVLLDDQSHIFHYELGGPALLAGALTIPVPCINGKMNVKDVVERIRMGDDHTSRTALLCIENTHNRAGGVAVGADDINALTDCAHEHGLKVHIDGARLFNAAVALGVSAAVLVENADSVMFCLSKGLSCPVGSLLVGNQEFIEKAKLARKLFGGGMRQVGVLAAPGLIALDAMIDRLADDHRKARQLAEGIAACSGFKVNLELAQTNMVYVETDELAETVAEKLMRFNILCIPLDKHRIRLVTHKDITSSDIEAVLAAFNAISSDN